MNITQELLNSISYMDAFSGANGSLSAKGVNMTTHPTDSNILDFLAILSEYRKKIEDKTDSKVIIKSIYESLLPYLGRIKFKELTNREEFSDEQVETFEELYRQLNSLIGLDNVKSEVNNLISFHRIQSLRQKAGLRTPKRTLHMSFTGNPGTGKTTVARIVGKMYKELGLLSKGHFIEVSRTDLIAGYQGQTALKVKEVIEKAKGGVLFIDEAYSLTENDHSDSYGRECLTELTKALEDYRKDLVVIVAGYTDLMTLFFESNPGLRSRFNTFIEFSDYQANELIEMLVKMAQDDDYQIDYTTKERIRTIIEDVLEQKPENFSNGRYVRNLYEMAIMNQAKRLIAATHIPPDELRLLKSEDFISFASGKLFKNESE